MIDMKKVMLVGRTHSGKTTLAEILTYGDSKSKKTQSVERIGNFIDTPGEFVEIPHLYRGLLVSSYDADIIVLVETIDDENSIFPPGFSSAFNREVIGVITKTDKDGDAEKVKTNLLRAGASKIFEVSNKDLSSFKELKEYLFSEG